MKFLLQRAPEKEAGRVLVVQTCNPNLLDHVTKDVLSRHPGAEVEVLLQRGMRPWIVLQEGVNYLDNPEADRAEMVKRLRRRRYDLVVVTLSGEAGYWKLRLLPFGLDPRQVRVYNRHAQSFVLNVFNVAGYAAQIAGGVAGAANPAGLTIRSLARKLAAPLTALYLACFLWRRRAAGADQAGDVAHGEEER